MHFYSSLKLCTPFPILTYFYITCLLYLYCFQLFISKFFPHVPHISLTNSHQRIFLAELQAQLLRGAHQSIVHLCSQSTVQSFNQSVSFNRPSFHCNASIDLPAKPSSPNHIFQITITITITIAITR